VTPDESHLLQQRHHVWADALRKPDFCGSLELVHTEGNGGFRIDGRQALLRNFDLLLAVIDLPHENRRVHPRYEEFRVFDESFSEARCTDEQSPEGPGSAVQLWADEALFTIGLYPIYGVASKARISVVLTLWEIRARTRGAIQRASFPFLLSGRNRLML
jgi:hypothetical protein